MPSYPGGAPVPFVPGLYQPNTTIADLILRAGQQRAESQQRVYEGLASSLAQLGQIPAEIQRSRALAARTAREEALTQEEQARVAELAHQARQRDLAARALGGGGEAVFVGPPSAQQQAAQGGQQNPTGASVLDPDVIIQRLQAAGADQETINKAVASAKGIAESKKEYRQGFKDMIAKHALEIFPMLGTKYEDAAVQTALASLQEEGVPQEKLAQLAQSYQEDPGSIRNVLVSAITQSDKALKDFNETYGKQTKVGPEDKVLAGVGLPGGGQVLAEGAGKPGTFESYVKSLYGDKPTPAQMENARQRWAQSGEAPGAAPQLTKGAIDISAEMFAKTGELPPMGMGKAGATVRQAILNRAAELHPGLDVAQNKAAFAANKASEVQLQKQTDAVSAFEETANKNSKILSDVMQRIPDLGTKFLNRPIRALAGQVGSEDMARFEAIRQSVQNEYAKIISNPTLSGTMSDAARKEGEALLSPSLTVGQLKAALETLGQEAENRRTSYQTQLETIQKRISGKKDDEGWQDIGGVRVRVKP